MDVKKAAAKATWHNNVVQSLIDRGLPSETIGSIVFEGSIYPLLAVSHFASSRRERKHDDVKPPTIADLFGNDGTETRAVESYTVSVTTLLEATDYLNYRALFNESNIPDIPALVVPRDGNAFLGLYYFVSKKQGSDIIAVKESYGDLGNKIPVEITVNNATTISDEDAFEHFVSMTSGAVV